MPLRILLVDDHALFRQGLRALLSGLADFQVVGEAPEGKTAISAALTLAPDIVVIGRALPGMNGIEVTSQIKRRLPTVRVIMLTTFKTDEYLRESLRVGVDGYLLKDASLDEFVTALRRVANGKKYLSPDLSSHLVDEFLNPKLAHGPKSALSTLTGRERNILQLIAEGRSNRSTGEFLSISPKTVEKHRAALMRKLGLHNFGELMMVAVEMGIIERPRGVSRWSELRPPSS
ncbi:MAG: response regulator transcription factor [Burkholderiaceae bacterium]